MAFISDNYFFDDPDPNRHFHFTSEVPEELKELDVLELLPFTSDLVYRNEELNLQ